MTKITVKVDGMMCGMCEAHINDTVRSSLPVKKVTSSHSKGQTVILTETDIDDQSILDAIAKSGYTPGTINREPYEKKRLFGR